jgi:hypothetical protein
MVVLTAIGSNLVNWFFLLLGGHRTWCITIKITRKEGHWVAVALRIKKRKETWVRNSTTNLTAGSNSRCASRVVPTSDWKIGNYVTPAWCSTWCYSSSDIVGWAWCLLLNRPNLYCVSVTTILIAWNHITGGDEKSSQMWFFLFVWSDHLSTVLI